MNMMAIYQLPFAQAFLGKRAGEKVDVVVPAGKMQFEILSVER